MVWNHLLNFPVHGQNFFDYLQAVIEDFTFLSLAKIA